MRQIRKRRALAGDLDEVGVASAQMERVVRQQLDDILQYDRLAEVGRIDQRAVRLRAQHDIRVEAPRVFARRAAMRDHAGFGRTEQLDDRCAVARFCFDRQFGA